MALSLPLIDLSPYIDKEKHKDEDRLSASRKLHNACVYYGFFYLKLDGFAKEEEMAELADLGRRFFHLDQKKKDEIRLANEDGARGEYFLCCCPIVLNPLTGYQRLKENITMGKYDVRYSEFLNTLPTVL